jgi:hypothetical protein
LCARKRDGSFRTVGEGDLGSKKGRLNQRFNLEYDKDQSVRSSREFERLQVKDQSEIERR